MGLPSIMMQLKCSSLKLQNKAFQKLALCVCLLNAICQKKNSPMLFHCLQCTYNVGNYYFTGLDHFSTHKV
ncbi:hypothetical protein T07_314 [Trichinella nelsoni]|uniref:Uncharacterized protein n=1 Tax=Trichinella nelsoni TaxID=6336 RepID=A0A0V0RK66_9BILA|nr:hypothetical protein T07_314 [Trichinella nelsoni]